MEKLLGRLGRGRKGRELYALLERAAAGTFGELADEVDAAKRARLLERLSYELREMAAACRDGAGLRGAVEGQAMREYAALVALLAEAEVARAERRPRRRSERTMVEEVAGWALDALADPRFGVVEGRDGCGSPEVGVPTPQPRLGQGVSGLDRAGVRAARVAGAVGMFRSAGSERGAAA